MMTWRMGGSVCTVLRRGRGAGLFLALVFTAGAASGGDNAAFVSDSGVPETMEPGDTASVTVTMRNTGTTTWQTTVVTETDDSTQTTTRTRYSLDAVGHGWGVNGVAVSGSVAPNATRSFEFTITAPETAGSYTFRWRMSRTTVVTDRPIHARSTPGTSFGAATPSQTIQVARDTAPSFGNLTIPDQEWLRGSRIEPVTLPEATGGNGTLSYALACYLPGGVTYNSSRKTISGTPRVAWGPTTCTWKVTDSDGNTAESDSDTLEFTIRVRRPVLVLSKTRLTVTEGRNETFTVKLATQPTGNVTVSVTSRDTGAAGVNLASLTFTAANYSTAKTVTVTGKQDADGEDESTTVALSASGGGYNNVSASVEVTVRDDDAKGIVVDPTSLTVTEGRNETFTVKLATQPTGNVTVSVTSRDTGAAGVNLASLTFTAANYSTAKTVTVTGKQDADGEDESTTVALSASGGGYNNVSASVEVTVRDDDAKGIVVDPTSLTVTEGRNETFTVKLATQPTGNVTVSVTSRDTGAAGVNLASLTFTAANYSTAKTVTVTGKQDADGEDESTTVALSASGGGYNNVSASVEVTVRDDDAKGIVVDPTSLTVTEGRNETFTVKLATQPTGNVTVSVMSRDTGAAGVNLASLTFTAANYSTAKTVTVTGKQDADGEDENTIVDLSASGGGYDGLSASVEVTVIDDDAKGIVVDPTSLTVTEGRNETFTVKLATQPTGTVTVSVSSGDTEAAGVNLASLTFTAANYSTAKTVTVTGKQDADGEDENTIVDLSASGGGYGSESASVPVKVTDNDTRGLVVTPAELREPAIVEGGSRTFTVKLATQPTGPVTVSVTSGDTGAAGVSPASLSFSTTNYSTSKTVTVTGVQDADASNESTSISLSASGGDYGSESASVPVSVTDDDPRGLVVSKTSVAVNEDGSVDVAGSNKFKVKLATQPTASVTVSVSSGDTGAATVSPASLSFGTTDYSEWQTVTVTGVQDDDASNESTSISLSASGGDYGNVSASVGVTVTDDDTRSLVVSATSVAVAEDGSNTFKVKLATRPTASVTVSVSSDEASEATASPASLSFTTANYSAWRTVTVTGVQDADASNESTSIRLNASGGDYGNESASVSVEVTDDDTRGLVVSATDLGVAEGGNGTFTVALATQPTASVTVSVSSGDTGAATASPASLSFTTADYSTSQTVTVTGVQDDDAENESTTVALSASGGDYGNESASVDVTVTDDDSTGLVVSATDLGVAEGGNGTFTVALATQPTGSVTVTVSSGDTGAATVSPASLSFTTADYSTSQTVTVAGVQDDDADNESATVGLTASGGDYGNVSSSVSVEVTDDDTQGLVLSATDLGVAEGGNGTFTVALATQPTGSVTVTVSSGDTGAATASPASLSFTAADYSASQTVTVTGVQDDDADNEDTSISLSASGGDYGNVSSSVSVEVTDDDTQGLVLSATDLGVAEGGNGTFTVALATQPTAAVTVTVSSGDTGAATVSPASLSFTTANYSTSQTVTVTGVQDDDAENESTTVGLSASGGDYGNESSSVIVTVTDDDTEVPEDTTPSFGNETIADLILTRNQAMAAATLPEATGGNGELIYSLTGDLPAGVTFNASARTLSGTPTAVQSALEYTYTATDTDGDAASLSFTIEVAGMGSDDASFVSYSNVPSTMTAGSMATVTVRMRNRGTTTWTSADGYALGSRRPLDNVTWGLNRVSLPSDVAPNATVDLTFEITAPATVQGHKFSWRMVRGASGWFGRKTDLLEIAVEAADSPSFGGSTIADQTWVKSVAIDSQTLPAATGGTGELAYTLTGTLPAGVTFDASTRTLSGTPAKKQEATEYTYTATDTDGDAASLSFTVEVAGRASDDASFVSYVDVPSTMAAGSSATVTVRMQNTGTTTWTSADGYQLGSQRPQDNVTWGLNRVSLPSEVAPNATVDFMFAITAPATVQGHNFRWRMLRGADGWFGDKTELRAITVEADESPSFGALTIPGQTWVKNTAIASSTLPAATGGNGELTYALAGTLPAGVTFDASTRTLSGTPAKKLAATEYTYTATDADGDAASLSFTIRVARRSSDEASFVSYTGVPSKMAAGGTATVTVRMRNMGTTTWTSADGYALGSQRPQDNVTWGLSRVSLASDVAPNATVDFTFAITAPATVKGHKFRWRMLRGTDGWFGDKTEIHEIAVEDPSFGDATIPDQTWARAVPIDALTLPEASGSGGVLTYTLTPSLPDGLAFTASTRTVSGTPTTAQDAVEYTYTATDIDGDDATLVFTIAIEAAETDAAAFVSVSGVPSKMAAGGTATVTVTMTNTGTTTWTSSAGYGFGSQSPQDNQTWGLSRVPVPSDVAPNETVAFTFTITAPAAPNSYTFAWRMVRDPGAWFGSGTGDVAIEVEDPSFGDATVADQTWAQDTAVGALTLPAASGTGGVLTYAVTPSPPAGVTFDASTRTLSGTPTAVQGPTEYTYTATDAGGDAATLSFSVAVAAALTDDASFVSYTGVPSKMAAGGTATVTVTMRNTGTTTWTSSAGYKLGSQRPQDNETWGFSRVSLPSDVAPDATAAFTFTITAPETTGSHRFRWRMIRDTDGWFGGKTEVRTIEVEDPSFGDATVADQTWAQNTAVGALTLPAASGGDGGLTYALTPSLPDGVTFASSTRTLSGTPTAVQEAVEYTYTATDADSDAATLSFEITVSQASSSSSSSSAARALPPPAPTGVFDMFEYWLLPRGSALTVQARLQDGRIAPAEGSSYVRSFWRGDLWGRNVALLGDPSGERYDIFEEVENGLDYWGTFEGAAAGGEARPSTSLDRPFRWMNRFMAVGDVVESPVTGRLLSNRRRTQEGVLEATMRLEIVAHRASFTVPAVDGLTFEDVLEVRFRPDVERAEAYDTFYLARGYGAVYSRRSAVAAPGGVVEWWAVEKALTPVVPAPPLVPWFDPFSPGWPKTAVLNGNLDDAVPGVEGGQVRSSEAPGWTADSGDAVIAQPPSGLDAGPWAMLLRGSGGGGDSAPDAAITEEWIPVEGGTYQLSACMRRENARDNVLVDFDDGNGRDADFADAHLVATSTGTWECRAVTKCIPASVGAVRIRAARDGANLGDAWFDRIELKRIAACAE